MFNQPKGAGALCIAHTPLVRGTWAVSAALSQGALASPSHPADAGQSEGALTCVAEVTAEPLMNDTAEALQGKQPRGSDTPATLPSARLWPLMAEGRRAALSGKLSTHHPVSTFAFPILGHFARTAAASWSTAATLLVPNGLSPAQLAASSQLLPRHSTCCRDTGPTEQPKELPSKT